MSVALSPRTPEEAARAVQSHPAVVARGGGTKWGLADPPPAAAILSTRGLAGVVEYDPGEFTITALAGTPLAELERLLAEHGQHLPFDPPFVGQGATLGGAIASGLAGPGRLRHGGVRDFVLGVRFVDGQGQLVRGGSRVVKNAAGFDLPKLLCGSRGRLGLLVEATLKVFPRPATYRTVVFSFDDLPSAQAALVRLLRSPVEPEAAELLAPEGPGGPPVAAAGWTLWVRLGGSGPVVAAARAAGLMERMGRPGREVEDDGALWRRLRDLEWAPPGSVLVRLHLVPGQLAEVDGLLGRWGALRHYSVGGHVAWAALREPPPWEELERALDRLGVPGLVLRGAPAGRVVVGPFQGAAMARRVKQALDPVGRFGPL